MFETLPLRTFIFAQSSTAQTSLPRNATLFIPLVAIWRGGGFFVVAVVIPITFQHVLVFYSIQHPLTVFDYDRQEPVA